MFLKNRKEISLSGSSLDNVESIKPDGLLVSGQTLAFGWEIRLGLCLDRLDRLMGYLQLRNRLMLSIANSYQMDILEM